MTISRCIHQARRPLAALAFGLFQLIGMSAANAAQAPEELRPGAPQSPDLTAASAPQQTNVRREQFIVKADLMLAKIIPEWAASRIAGRHAFINLCMDRSARYGLLSERSVLAYTHSSIWLGQRFEEASAPLMELLNSKLHEVRKTHAMLAWVDDQYDPKATPASGEVAIASSVKLTEPWGNR